MKVLALQLVVLAGQLGVAWRERRRQRASDVRVRRDRMSNLAILGQAQDTLAQAREFIPDIGSDIEPDDPR